MSPIYCGVGLIRRGFQYEISHLLWGVLIRQASYNSCPDYQKETLHKDLDMPTHHVHLVNGTMDEA